MPSKGTLIYIKEGGELIPAYLRNGIRYIYPLPEADEQLEGVEEKEPPKKEKKKPKATKFLSSMAWRNLRMDALIKYGARCQCCGARATKDLKISVDHIKPRSLYPELSLDINNLQVLCEDCNFGKGIRDTTDWRA